MIVHERDYLIDYFGFKTLERSCVNPQTRNRRLLTLYVFSYLLRIENLIVERPQHLLMRVAVGIHKDNLERVIESYDLMSEKFFTHASPPRFRSMTTRSDLPST